MTTMNIENLEHIMFELSAVFLAPVLILLMLLFAYSLFAIGGFSVQSLQRRKHHARYMQFIRDPSLSVSPKTLRAFPLATLFHSTKNPQALTKDQLDVAALEELETVRMVSRLAPMLGLIATMVPMGPALKSLADGNVQGISENLIVAFSAVIFGLLVASITFWIATIKKRWLANELVNLTPHLFGEQVHNTLVNSVAHAEAHREAA